MGRLILCCSPENDLHMILSETGKPLPRYDCLNKAVDNASHGDGVLALSDSYPVPRLRVEPTLLEKIEEKDLKLYVEYPLALPGIVFGEPRTVEWERLVVTSRFFEPELPRMSILNMHDCWFLPVEEMGSHLMLAKVAGYDKAVFGLPEDSHPVLFEHSKNIMVSTSKLSQFRTGRYAPSGAWKQVWIKLLKWLTGETYGLSWVPTVRTAFGKSEPLPAHVEKEAYRRSVEWFRKHVLFGVERNRGVIEGYQSNIDYEGHQLKRVLIRSDCLAEAAMVFAYDWRLTGNPRSRLIATRILDYVWSFQQSEKNSPAYGLVNWMEGLPVFYGDDNARVILSTLSASSSLGEDRWDRPLALCLLANLRTTGPLGFRRNRIDLPDLVGNGWEYYWKTPVTSYSPHYQAYLWACFLWGFLLTGYQGFLEKNVNAIRMTVEKYPDWRWTNGLTQELARMTLPLAFLIRVEDNPEHRKWVDKIGGELVSQQQSCGAIRELLGPEGKGQYPPPSSNEQYGTTEAPVIQENGDPACDLLYTSSFAFLGLHELASACESLRFKQAEDRLAEFLCRIQLRSEDHPYLEGCWMRGFDYEKWEYWGSSSDTGWGAWSVESGWTNSWITAVFAMRLLNEPLFNLKRRSEFKQEFEEVFNTMLPSEE
ncbi:MAG: hypothetical protein FGF50_00270 [Candidatus Brockarchaeota archaeon]|nr:hypothetical protein [Candidatus Brockarchaeota archaeon]